MPKPADGIRWDKSTTARLPRAVVAFWGDCAMHRPSHQSGKQAPEKLRKAAGHLTAVGNSKALEYLGCAAPLLGTKPLKVAGRTAA
jgi:hypothetical protein